jgi:hypothetical protein
MPMVRCPSCGRISDGTICLACGADLESLNPAQEATQVRPIGETTNADSMTQSGFDAAGAQNFDGLSELSQDAEGVELSDFDEDDDLDASANHRVEEVWGDEMTSETFRPSELESRENSLEVPGPDYDDDEEADAETVTDFKIDDLPSEIDSETTLVDGQSNTRGSVEGPSQQIRLSARVGILAEAMETAGKLADASTLYEAEELLQKLGH